MDHPDISPAFAELMDEVWRTCVGLIADGLDYSSYVTQVRHHHADLSAQQRARLAWPIMLALGRVAWRRTPQPRLNFTLAPTPAPQRNAPCDCGSGIKYKHCCLPLEQAAPVELHELNLLPVLLDTLPRQRWSELVGSRVAVDMVGHAAFEWNGQGRAEDVRTLLEPWFVADADFHAKREILFDALLDAYTALRNAPKKAQLLDRALAVGDRPMRTAALQRRATMLADAGDFRAAWQLFAEAQRVDPQSTGLSHLEITLLMAEGRHAEMRERARFWAHRLTAMRDPALGELIDFMRDVAERGPATLQQVFFEQEPTLGELAALLQDAPPITAQYTLDPGADDAGPLKPKPVMRKALQAWHAAAGDAPGMGLFDMGEPVADDIAAWLPVLRTHPQLWNAFEVLDKIVDVVQAHEPAVFHEAIVHPVLDRAEHVLREVLRANRAEGKTLEWAWLENRPALRLLGERIASQDEDTDDPTHLARLEWLVCTLNPKDNQGFRDTLMRAYLRANRAADALALSERYPGDFAAMHYNHVLALFALNRPDDALIALQHAVRAYRKPLAWLLKTRPKAPRLDSRGMRIGGDDEAWYYRQDTLALWEKLGALAWLRASARTVKPHS
jgi:tetratricopeptide (TPR) repeat protein